MQIALESDLMVVGEARNNFIGPQLIEESRPDVLIMDLDMSWIDCNHFVENLRNKAITIPIIILGFDSDLADCAKVFAGSTIRYVEKQTSMKELFATIRQAGMQSK